jgi:hypothetical protein
MDKEHVVYIYIYTHNGKLALKKEENPAIWSQMDGPAEHCIKWNKLDAEYKHCMISVICGLWTSFHKRRPEKWLSWIE